MKGTCADNTYFQTGQSCGNRNKVQKSKSAIQCVHGLQNQLRCSVLSEILEDASKVEHELLW